MPDRSPILVRLLPPLLPLLALLAACGGCGEGDDAAPSRLIVLHSFEERTDVLSEAPDLLLDDEDPQTGETSLMIFAEGLRQDWLFESDTGAMEGDQIAVTGWARTHVMQRPVSLRLVLTPAEGDPLIMTQLLEDVRRTTPWIPFRAEFPVPEGFTLRTAKVGVQIPHPGRLWLDELKVWDEVRTTR